VRLTLVANLVSSAHPEAPKEAVLLDGELFKRLWTCGSSQLKNCRKEIKEDRASLIRAAGHAQALIALQDRPAASCGNETTCD